VLISEYGTPVPVPAAIYFLTYRHWIKAALPGRGAWLFYFNERR
jgi:hypothetical protein